MQRQIDPDTLRRWLDEGRPVTVLDIRSDADRAEWAVPGSIHVNAYEALRSGQPGALATFNPPPDHPIVTVCAAGRVSRTAADMLSARGMDACSLAGGMNAWSLAWNTADVPVPDTPVRIIQVRRTGKGCLSYLVGADADAVVIDPSLPPQVYLDLAMRHRWRIRQVLETHLHADHLSRAAMLARAAGASLLFPDHTRARFPFSPVHDGDRIAIGRVSLAAIRTPGHTDESTSYVLEGAAVFSGDTLFTKGVGRPDLHARGEGASTRARALFRSLRRLRELGREILVLPAHSSEPAPFDGRPIAATMHEALKWQPDWFASEARFAEQLVSRLPETPPNFARIVALNEAGEFPAGDPTELEAGANRCAIG